MALLQKRPIITIHAHGNEKNAKTHVQYVHIEIRILSPIVYMYDTFSQPPPSCMIATHPIYTPYMCVIAAHPICTPYNCTIVVISQLLRNCTIATHPIHTLYNCMIAAHPMGWLRLVGSLNL